MESPAPAFRDRERPSRLRLRVVGLMRQLDGASAYRALIERDLAALVGRASGPSRTTDVMAVPDPETPAQAIACATCAVENEPDARFCKACGARLEASS